MPVRTRIKPSLVPYLDSDGSIILIDLPYASSVNAKLSTSPTFDDSDGAINYHMSNEIETMDANQNYYWSEVDSDYNVQISNRSV